MNNNTHPLSVIATFSIENLYNGEVSKVEEVTYVINHRGDREFASTEDFVQFYAKHLIKAFASKQINEGTFMNPDYATIERKFGKVISIKEHIVEASNEPFDYSSAIKEDARYNYNG